MIASAWVGWPNIEVHATMLSFGAAIALDEIVFVRLARTWSMLHVPSWRLYQVETGWTPLSRFMPAACETRTLPVFEVPRETVNRFREAWALYAHNQAQQLQNGEEHVRIFG